MVTFALSASANLLTLIITYRGTRPDSAGLPAHDGDRKVDVATPIVISAIGISSLLVPHCVHEEYRT